MAHHPEQATAHAPGLQPRQYVLIGLTLTVITIVELGVSYSGLEAIMVPLLLGLSAVKFALVVGLFMHLRYEPRLLTQIFVSSLALAIAVGIALLVLFWSDHADGIEAARAYFERVVLP